MFGLALAQTCFIFGGFLVKRFGGFSSTTSIFSPPMAVVCVRRAGMQLNNQLLQLLGLRFADEKYGIDFDDYLTCIVRLENMFRTSRSRKHPHAVSGMTGNHSLFLLPPTPPLPLLQEFSRLWMITKRAGFE